MATESRLLLAIDDDATDRQRIIRWLGHEYAICEAATARVGVDMARRLRPACVLLDYQLTDASGLDVLDDLIRGDLSVVFFTGQGNEDVAVRALKAGAVDYLIKDRVTREELAEAIAQAMHRTAARRPLGEPSHRLRGFGELASSLLRPRISRASVACAEAIRAQPELEPVLRDAVSALVEADEHVSGLTSFADLDELCAQTETVDLAEVGERVGRGLRERHGDPDVPVRFERLPIVTGSRPALEWLLTELTRCAMRHVGRESEGGVRVSAELTRGAWRIHVDDDGPLPSEAELSREVFIPYRRGTGRDLSFALAAQVVQRHGGEIWIEPGDPTGCQVTFSLPFR